VKKVLLGVYLFILISTIPYIRFFQDYIKTKKLTSLYDGVLGFLLVFLALFVFYNLLYKKKFGLRHILSYALTLALFVVGMYAINDTVERVHFLQYGGVVILLYQVLKENRNDLSLYLWIFFSSVFVGIADEWVQWWVPSRFGEIRDIYINLLATLCGIFCIHFLVRSEKITLRIDRNHYKQLVYAFVILVLALGVFIHSAHIAHFISDPQIGGFRSTYDQKTLLEFAHTRMYLPENQIQPLRTQPVQNNHMTMAKLLAMWCKEDFYKTEAEFHCGERNRALQQNKYKKAYYEDLILEKYYLPLIKDSSFRWDETRRSEIRKQAKKSYPEPAPYVSPVLSHYWTFIEHTALWAIICGICLLAIVTTLTSRSRI